MKAMVGLMVMVLFATSCFAVETSFTATGGYGVHRTTKGIADLSVDLKAHPNMSFTAAVGKFGNSEYVSAGVNYRLGYLLLGLSGAYLDEPSSRLTGNEQFKLSAGLDLYRGEKLTYRVMYFHFSNGSKPSNDNNNWGEDFVALSIEW